MHTWAPKIFIKTVWSDQPLANAPISECMPFATAAVERACSVSEASLATRDRSPKLHNATRAQALFGPRQQSTLSGTLLSGGLSEYLGIYYLPCFNVWSQKSVLLAYERNKQEER